MKAGILTFHRASNVGAALQAAALHEHIRSLGVDCELIDYYPNNAPRPRGALFRLLRFGKRILNRNDRRQHLRQRRFDAFWEEHYTLSKKVYFGDVDIQKDPPAYDLLISGSDQILNTTLTGNSSAYYLAFETDATKVSYASSFGRADITETEREFVRKEFPKFKRLSAREESAEDIIESLIGTRPQTVLDPVFLLEKEKWASYCNQAMAIPHDQYIFVYSMERSEALLAVVRQLHRQTGLPVITVLGGGNSAEGMGTIDEICGPAEFLRYVMDAMSLIFGKKVFCVAHAKRNARLANLLKLVGAEHKQVTAIEDADALEERLINGAVCYPSMESLVDGSKRYVAELMDIAAGEQ